MEPSRKAAPSSRAAVILTVWLLAAGAAPAAPAGKPPSGRPDIDLPVEGVITNPDWVSRPNGEDVSNAYPRLSRALSLSGRADIQCTVSAQGLLRNCKVTAEAPKGMGFGEAALSLAPSFHMRPRTVDGVADDSGEVTVPIKFQMEETPDPESEPTPPLGPPPPAGAMALAGKLMEVAHVDSGMEALLAKIDAQLETLGAQTPQSPEEQAAIGALMKAARDYAQTGARRRQEGLARNLSERQMSDLSAFFQGPAGQAWLAQADAARVADEKAAEGSGAAIVAAARRQFCAAVPCLGEPAPRPAPVRRP